MDWEVRLDGDSDALQMLADLTQRPEIAVAHSERGYVLRGTRFANLTDASRVRQAAIEITRVLSGLLRLQIGATQELAVGAVFRLRNDGPADTFIGMKPAVLHVQALPTSIQVTLADGTTETHAPADAIPDFLAVALECDSVAKAMRLWERAEPSWGDLYRIFEVIEEEAGGRITSEWSTRSDVERFTRSANSPAASGEASRHGRERYAPPRNTITLAEATAFLRRLTLSWLRSHSEESRS